MNPTLANLLSETNVTILDFSNPNGPIRNQRDHDGLVAALPNCQHVHTISFSFLTDSLVIAISRMTWLNTLNLAFCNRISDRQLCFLLDSVGRPNWLPVLRRLNLSGKSFSPASMNSLRLMLGRFACQLQHLHLDDCLLNDGQVENLSNGLFYNQSLVTLSLRANPFDSIGITALGEAIQHQRKLTTLILDNNWSGNLNHEDICEFINLVKYSYSFTALVLSQDDLDPHFWELEDQVQMIHDCVETLNHERIAFYRGMRSILVRTAGEDMARHQFIQNGWMYSNGVCKTIQVHWI